MKKNPIYVSLLLAFVITIIVSCKKESFNIDARENLKEEIKSLSARKSSLTNPPYDLNVTLRGECTSENEDDCPTGHLKFRQDPNPEKIIDLDIKVHHLLPNHEYLLQRAVDAANVVDGNCTSTTWLTLGKGLTPQSILTDGEGKGQENLWRNITMIPSGSKFDIHFQVIDKVTNAVIISSDCYQYQVR